MNVRLILALLLLFPALAFAEKPRTAIVDMNTLFQQYHVAISQRGSIDTLRERLKDDPRMVTIAEATAELQKLQKILRDPSVSETDKERYFKQFQMKAHELKSLQRDTKQHIDTEQSKINSELVTVTRRLLVDIRNMVSTVAEEEGYELVFETGGTTSSQVPTLLYARHANDITDLVLARLNKGQESRIKPENTKEALSQTR